MVLSILSRVAILVLLLTFFSFFFSPLSNSPTSSMSSSRPNATSPDNSESILSLRLSCSPFSCKAFIFCSKTSFSKLRISCSPKTPSMARSNISFSMLASKFADFTAWRSLFFSRLFSLVLTAMYSSELVALRESVRLMSLSINLSRMWAASFMESGNYMMRRSSSASAVSKSRVEGNSVFSQALFGKCTRSGVLVMRNTFFSSLTTVHYLLFASGHYSNLHLPVKF
mmetsp:Transcript_87507/g.189586  ORF Transcript_87507/g.189586 Transcript_87507/m.189586 type:complete len:227 (-) Transcript_87507:135-815(-)